MRPDWHTRIEGDALKTLTVQRGQNADCTIYADGVTIEGEQFTHGTRKDDGSHTKHPWRINLHNSRTPVRVEAPDGSRIMLRPIQPNTVKATIDGNRATYSQFWDGIDIERIVTPEGLVELLTVTSAAGQRVLEWAVTGDTEAFHFAPYYGDDDPVSVPFTYEDGTLAYDLTDVPVGAVVR